MDMRVGGVGGVGDPEPAIQLLLQVPDDLRQSGIHVFPVRLLGRQLHFECTPTLGHFFPCPKVCHVGAEFMHSLMSDPHWVVAMYFWHHSFGREWRSASMQSWVRFLAQTVPQILAHSNSHMIQVPFVNLLTDPVHSQSTRHLVPYLRWPIGCWTVSRTSAQQNARAPHTLIHSDDLYPVDTRLIALLLVFSQTECRYNHSWCQHGVFASWLSCDRVLIH